jgi:hypothetical protein
MRWTRNLVLGYCVSATLFCGCSDRHQTLLDQQPQLATAALAFNKADVSNRLAEAKILLSTLPRCPIVSEVETASGKIIMRDYSNPSYKLQRRDIAPLLGNPYEATSDSCTYIVATDRDRNVTEFLVITFDKDLVVDAILFGSGRKGMRH